VDSRFYHESDQDEEGSRGEDDAEEEFEAQLEKPKWLRDMPFWAVSALLHLVLLLVLLGYVVETRQEPEPEVQITVRPPEKPPEYDPLRKRAMEKKPEILQPKVEKPVIQRKVDDVTPDIPKGTDLSKLTNMDLRADSVNASLGVGGGAASAYGERWGRGSLTNEGGSQATEEAVRAALEWLLRHQSPDGSWKSRDFYKQANGESRNVNHERYPTDRGFPEYDVGVTGLAMLAFTGYGHTHRDGVFPQYVDVLRKAVGYLKRKQVRSKDPATNGRYGGSAHEQWIYDHAIATMAMGEILIMSGDAIGLRRSVKNAVQLCLHARNEDFGWRYGIKPNENDTSVSGWMVLALKTAKNARLGIPSTEFERAFEGALSWFERVTDESGRTGYEYPGDDGSVLTSVYPEPYPFSKELSCMTAVGVLCRLFAGESRKNKAIRNGIDLLMQAPPRWQEAKGRALSTINLYYWYYGTYALFQFGGAPWKEWNLRMQESLLSTQRQGNIDEDGSWDPIGEWGIAGGRVYTTAIGAMTLEVYYRFKRAQQGVGL